MMELESLIALLRRELEGEVDPDAVVPSARLIADLGLDSLQLLRVVVLVESLAPIEIPEQLDPEDITIGDLHHYLSTLVEHGP